jgi:hypothetical protein
VKIIVTILIHEVDLNGAEYGPLEGFCNVCDEE